MAKTIKQRIALEGGEEIRKGLKAIGAEGQKAFEEVRKSAEDLNKGLGTASEFLGKVEAQAREFGSSIRDLVEHTRDFASNLFEVGKAAAAAGAAVFEMARQTSNAGDEAIKGAQAAGVSTREYGRLMFAMRLSGVQAEQAQRLFSELNDALSSPEPSKAKDALSALGVSVVRLGNGTVDTERLIGDIADRFAAMPDGVQKSGLAIDLFGKRVGTRLIPFLNSGSAGVKQLGDQAERLGFVFDKVDAQKAERFGDALDTVLISVGGLRNAFAVPFLEPFAEGMESLAEAIGSLRPAIRDISELIVTGLQAAFKSIGAVVVPVFKSIYDGLQRVVAMFNEAFGTNLTAQHVIVVAAFGAIALAIGKITAAIGTAIPAFGTLLKLFVGVPSILGTITSGIGVLSSTLMILFNAVKLLAVVFGGLPVLIVAVVAAIALLVLSSQTARDSIINAFKTAWGAIAGGAATAYETITGIFAAIGEFFTGLWLSVVETAAGTWESIVAGVVAVRDGLINAFRSAIDTIFGFFKKLYDSAIQVFDKIIEAAKRVAAAVKSAMSGGGAPGRADGGGVAFAGGGRVHGPGTGTSDSILARLSNGEFVQRAKAVRYYGVDFMNAVNSLRFPKPEEFALGGLVSGLTQIMPVPFYADGGLAEGGAVAAGSGGRPVVLQLGGESFGLNGPDDVVDRLQRFATGQSLRTPGRKPSWKRG